MEECEGLALVTFARNENWQDGQGGLAKVATVQVMMVSSGLPKGCDAQIGTKIMSK